MTNLTCSVNSCRYNDDYCCCKKDIMVEGKSATDSNETCCGDFAEKTTNSASNRVGEPEKATEVGCKAENCTYNENCKCNASSIDVGGRRACCCGETQCSTFCCD